MFPDKHFKFYATHRVPYEDENSVFSPKLTIHQVYIYE